MDRGQASKSKIDTDLVRCGERETRRKHHQCSLILVNVARNHAAYWQACAGKVGNADTCHWWRKARAERGNTKDATRVLTIATSVGNVGGEVVEQVEWRGRWWLMAK